jgi:hypothetical protein
VWVSDFVIWAVCWLSLLAVVLIHLGCLLLSCTGIPVATPVLYVCTCTPVAYTMMAVWLYQYWYNLGPCSVIVVCDMLFGLCLICRMGFCGLGCTNAANFNAGLLG